MTQEVLGLEVSIDGTIVGVYVPPTGGVFAAMVGNIPRTHMRGNITSSNDTETWAWQLPDVQIGQSVSFRLVAANGMGVAPHEVRRRDPAEVDSIKERGRAAYAAAKSKMTK
jgi:hypothetical protein